MPVDFPRRRPRIASPSLRPPSVFRNMRPRFLESSTAARADRAAEHLSQVELEHDPARAAHILWQASGWLAPARRTCTRLQTRAHPGNPGASWPRRCWGL